MKDKSVMLRVTVKLASKPSQLFLEAAVSHIIVTFIMGKVFTRIYYNYYHYIVHIISFKNIKLKNNFESRYYCQCSVD